MNDPNPSEPTPPAQELVAPPVTRPQYEFDDSQNRIIDDLASAILWVRVPLIVAGVFQVLIAIGLAFRLSLDGAHIIGILGHTLAAVVCFLMSSWLLRASLAFTRITTTAGRDIAHLMQALGNLRSWFDLLAFFVKLYLALLAVMILVLVIGLTAGAFQEPPK